MDREDSYPGFKYKASELSAFGVAIDTFVISLRNKELVRFTPIDAGHFRAWLTAHGIRDVDKVQKPDIKPSDTKPKHRRFF
jgi:hypothetical protein